MGILRSSEHLAGRILQRGDVRARPFIALLRCYFLMDLRSQHYGRATGTGPKAMITPLFWVVAQFLFLGGVVAVILFARVDAYFFSLISLAVSMIVIATSIIAEFREVVMDPADLEVIGHRPVPIRTYSAARVGNLLGYVLLMTMALNLFPAILGVALRDTGWSFFISYSLAAFLGNLIGAGVVILFFTIGTENQPGNTLKEVLSWTQIVLIMVAVYGGQIVLRDSHSRLEMAAYDLPSWVHALPPALLASFVDSCCPGGGPARWWILCVAILLVIGLWMMLLRRLAAQYARMQPGSAAWQRTTVPPLSREGALGGRIWRNLVRSREEMAAFWLCSTMIRRDADLRMRTWPALGIVVGVVLVGMVSGQIGDPFVENDLSSVLSIVCLYLLAFPLPTLFHNLNFSRDYPASWSLECAPLLDRVAFGEGIRKAITYRILLPVLLALGCVFGLLWGDFLHALAHMMTGWLVITAAGHATQIWILRRYPFSMPMARGATLGSIAMISGFMNGVAMVLATAHHFLVQTAPGFALYLVFLIALVLTLRRISRRVLFRRFLVETIG